MIKLTLLNESEILINTNQIDAVISDEQSAIKFKNGNIIKVKESSVTILRLIKSLAYRDESY